VDGVCGNTLQDGDLLPATSFWSESGATDINDPSCLEVNGGELLYGYNYPVSSSLNTGYGTQDLAAMFFAVDAEGRGYFVLGLDFPGGSEDPGLVDLEIVSPDLGGKGVQILLYDDPEGGFDTYAWDSATGTGNMHWKWGKCCTDGMVMGYLPAANFTFTLRFTPTNGISSGLSGYALGSMGDDTMDYVTLGMAQGDDGLQVSGYTCDDYCALHVSCGTCSADPACGWCTSSPFPNQCLSVTSARATQCAAVTDAFTSSGCCSDCTDINTPLACVKSRLWLVFRV
jgi:hypothetical protein